MLKDITVGQFYPGNSLVHKLDPRLKIIIMLFYIISLFFVNTYIPYVFIALYLLLIIKVADIPLKIVLKGIRPLKWILLITFVINLFFIQGEEIFRIGFYQLLKKV